MTAAAPPAIDLDGLLRLLRDLTKRGNRDRPPGGQPAGGRPGLRLASATRRR
jgi:hypothetical protein